MIMMARGIRRGQRRAWFVASAVLSFTVFAHVLRGGTFIASFIAASILALLVVERRYFQATTDRSSARAAMPRLGLIAFVSVLTASIGIEVSSGRHHLPAYGVVLVGVHRALHRPSQYRPAGPRRRFRRPVAPRRRRVAVHLVALRTDPTGGGPSTLHDRARYRASPRRTTRARDRSPTRSWHTRLLRPARRQTVLLLRDSLVAYAVYGGVALLSPDPIGPEAERSEAFSAFRSYAEGRGWTVGVIGASEEWLSIYGAAGLHHLYIGDEAIVDCPTFNLAGGKMKGLRQAATRLARHGYTVEFLDPSNIDPSPRHRHHRTHLDVAPRRGRAWLLNDAGSSV